MLLILRFSSVLECNAVVGPLQLALFRMLIDLVVILVQFFFVIMAFSLAITKSYIAEMSYMTSPNNQTGDLAKYNAWVFSAICFALYCNKVCIDCLTVRFHGQGSLKTFFCNTLSLLLKEHSHGNFSYSDHRQNYRWIEGNLKIILYKERKTPKR